MSRLVASIIFITLIAQSLSPGARLLAQQALCSGDGRYVDSVFTCVNVNRDLIYGSGSLDWSWNNLLCLNLRLPPYQQQTSLRYDLYEPCSDTAQLRPLIVMVHGGAWAGGSKSDMEAVSRYYAHKGYLVAAINYRLALPSNILCWNQDADSIRLHRALFRGIADTKLALQHLRQEAVQLKIDTSAIFILGVSAGAFNAIGAVFMDRPEKRFPACNPQPQLGDWLGNLFFPDMGEIPGDEPGSAFTSVRAVVNISGGILDTGLITGGIYPTLLSIHGDMDDVVPFQTACLLPTIRSAGLYTHCIKSYGSSTIDSIMRAKNLKHQLIRLQGAIHAFTPVELQKSLMSVDSFLCQQLSTITSTTDNQPNNATLINVYPNPMSDHFLVSAKSAGEFRLFNKTGHLVYQIKINPVANNTVCRATGLKPGIYFWEFTNTVNSVQHRGKLICKSID